MSIARDPDLYKNQLVLINEDSEILNNIIKHEMKIISEEDVDKNKLKEYKHQGYNFIQNKIKIKIKLKLKLI